MRIHRGSALRVARALLAASSLVLPLRSASAQSAPERPEAVPISGAAAVAIQSISAARIREHVRFLSHDLLEGRGTGQRGGDLAAQYIATQFALYGLEPAGDGGTFLQRVPLFGITTAPETRVSIAGPDGSGELELKPGDEYVATDETQQAQSEVAAPIVFVGYGIDAPEYGWNDYKDVDVKGKVLLMFVNEPSSNDPKFFEGPALTYYGRWTYKFEQAARKGAVGVLLMHKVGLDPYGWDVIRNSNSGERSYLKLEGPALQAAARVQESVVRGMLERAGQSLDEFLQRANSAEFRPLELPLQLRAHMVSRVRPFESSNVIGRVPGSDAKLREQGVLYTAHYDHLGIRPERTGDTIYNGAMDNATGCGIVLELARAFGAAPQKPRRSVYFASVTAEEQGLLGSRYLGQHPPIAAEQIALDLNFDDLPALGVPEETQVGGAERTSFYPAVQQAAELLGLRIVPDAHPNEGHYYRSDHFSLARVGIPAFSIAEGMKYRGHPRQWGEERFAEYRDGAYHQPSDEFRPDMDFSGDGLMARFGLVLGWKAAGATQTPSWRKGDEFEAVRRGRAAAADPAAKPAR